METPGIEPGAFRMRSGRSTTELHPHAVVGEAEICKNRIINTSGVISLGIDLLSESI